MGVTEKGGSGFHSFNPISTLERQYVQGSRLLIFVRANPNCMVPGGVQGILSMKPSGTLSQEHEDVQSLSSESSDPFFFLGEDDPTPLTESEAKKMGIGSFFKKTFKNTTQQLERGMHNLAIRADKGRNPDLFVVGIYDAEQPTNLYSMTESQPMPDEEDRRGGLRFSVPLTLPPEVRNNPQKQVIVKIWIRSGAALLTGTKVAKNFLVGSAHLHVGKLLQALQSNQQAAFLHLQLQSTVVVDARVSLCVVQDLKFPALCGRGWSLADPHVSGYQSGIFHLPLDQSYAYGLVAKPNSFLIASERTVESTVVLPIAAAWAQLAADAAQISLHHAESLHSILMSNRHDNYLGEQYGLAKVGLCYLKAATVPGSSPMVSASWQRPDSVFEVELLAPQKLPYQKGTSATPSGMSSFQFYPKPVPRENILPSILAAAGQQLPPHNFMLGIVRVQIDFSSPLRDVAALGGVDATSTGEQWEAMLNLDWALQRPPNSSAMMEVPVYHSLSRQQMGFIVLSLDLSMQSGAVVAETPRSVRGGLVSLVGLDAPTETVIPLVDTDLPETTSDISVQQRREQLKSLGYFMSSQYTDNHINTIRTLDCNLLKERAHEYAAVLALPPGEITPAHEDKRPRPFRPSSSRSEMLLSGIPFNVHTTSFDLNVLDPSLVVDPPTGALFYNVTCGAPADHARGFSNVFPKRESKAASYGLNSPVGPVSGGLRRLEMKRQELIKVVTDLQTTLQMSIANYFTVARQTNPYVNHVLARDSEIQGLRYKLIEAVQSLHHVTWICAIRRSSVFSQALGLAVTSYLAALSDPAKWQSTWPDFWAQHGYLVSFEGLLSAAGKELGMIEDAYTGITMLQRSKVVFICDDGQPGQHRVPVPHSPYLKWLSLTTTGEFSKTEYTLKLGVIPSYYNSRIPVSLRNGVPVHFYPLLFEVGVDIRQWGAYAGSNMKNQLNQSEPAPGVGLIDDEDDDVGVSDEDVLVQLNYEAFQKMNAYAFKISPAATLSPIPQKTHPLLETLYQHIVGSSGKMNHDILDEAAQLAQQLGGGGLVFCKSGKDRTAMHITFKMAQFANLYRQRHPSPDVLAVPNTTLQDATIMRIYGTRLPICEKNVGESKYAFNSLQVQFMPQALKPPMNTLAGFLKGGKVFTGGGIES